MKKYLIETSVIVSYLRGKKEAVELLETLEGELAASFVSLAELYEGIYRVRHRNREGKGVKIFFAGLSAVYGLDEEIARYFGRIRLELKKTGKIVEDLDILLAATCLAHNLILVTYNPGHFKRVEGLEILP